MNGASSNMIRKIDKYEAVDPGKLSAFKPSGQADISVKVESLKKYCKTGSVGAMLVMASLCKHGIVVKKSLLKAIKYYKLASDKGNPTAKLKFRKCCLRLGECYTNTRGTKSNESPKPSKKEEKLRTVESSYKAAVQGNKEAKAELMDFIYETMKNSSGLSMLNVYNGRICIKYIVKKVSLKLPAVGGSWKGFIRECLFAHLPEGLQTLDLSLNHIGAEGVKELAPHLPKGLQTLNLGLNDIGDEGVKELAPHLPEGLQTLDFDCNGIGDEGVKELALHLPEGLQKLNLWNNNIGDEGVKELAPHLPKGLQTLNLGSNKLGDEGVKELARHLPEGLQALNLDWNNIGDDVRRTLCAKYKCMSIEFQYSWNR